MKTSYWTWKSKKQKRSSKLGNSLNQREPEVTDEARISWSDGAESESDGQIDGAAECNIVTEQGYEPDSKCKSKLYMTQHLSIWT